MNEKLKDVQTKVVTFWNKYDKKRKVQLVSVAAAVVIMLIILAVVVSRPTYVTLIECEDTQTAASITELLTSSGIAYETENNGLIIMVEEADQIDATYLIAQNGYTAKGYTMEDYVEDVGIGTTSKDRDRLFQKYLEDKMVQTLKAFDYVRDASVTFSMPDTNYSVLDDEEETFVSVKLTLSKNIPDGAADSMAKYIATAVGNETTSRVMIIDSKGNRLFANTETSASISMSATEMENIRNLFRDEVVTNVTNIFTATGYNEVTVAPSLDITFDKVDVVDTEYRNPDEVKYNDYIYEQEGSTGASGIPGTDSNDNDSGYLIDNGDGTTTSVTINKNEYAPSSTITHTEGERGKCNYNTSKVTVVLNKYKVYEEETADTGDLSWEEFKTRNDDVSSLEVDTDIMKAAISTATGIPVENITVMAYSVPMFNDYISETEFTRDILPIIVAVIILVLLAFIVWRSLRPVEVTEVETELSVDELLAATKDRQRPVEEIEADGKSEVRKAIEKFVDENPESVALLLRNWLNDDWN